MERYCSEAICVYRVVCKSIGSHTHSFLQTTGGVIATQQCEQPQTVIIRGDRHLNLGAASLVNPLVQCLEWIIAPLFVPARRLDGILSCDRCVLMILLAVVVRIAGLGSCLRAGRQEAKTQTCARGHAANRDGLIRGRMHFGPCDPVRAALR